MLNSNQLTSLQRMTRRRTRQTEQSYSRKEVTKRPVSMMNPPTQAAEIFIALLRNLQPPPEERIEAAREQKNRLRTKPTDC